MNSGSAPPPQATNQAELPPAPQAAMGHLGSHLRLWVIACAGLAADLWTKHWADEVLKNRPARPIAEGLLSFQYSTNPGALFGMGKELAPLFIGASVFALLFVIYVFAKSAATRYSFHIALGMVLAGALGNLYDRLFVGGRVRDFIKIELKLGDTELWPWIFNVADMLLVCGVAILMLNIWFDRDPQSDPEREHSTTPA